MLDFRLVFPATGEIVQGDGSLLERWRAEPDSWIWLDIEGAITPEIEQLLTSCFDLNPLALQDAARDRHPAKIERFEGYTFLLYRGLAATDHDTIHATTLQIALFVGGRFLVSRHSAYSPSCDRLKQEFTAAPADFEYGPASLAVRLGRLVVTRFLRMLLEFEPELEEAEERLLSEEGEAVLTELAAHRSALIRLQRILHNQAQMTRQLRDWSLPGLGEDQVHALNDVHEQQERIASLVTMYYQLATDLIEGYISVASHRLNQIMRVLTIVTVIFAPLSFLAGLYGMNFEFMPELGWRPGYYVLLALMTSVAVTLLWVFRRRRWL